MSFLDRFRKQARRVEDGTFGELTHDPPWWRGQALFRPCSDDVAVNLEADEHGPTSEQRARFRELDQKYHDLLPLIGAALWELYQPVRAEFEGDPDARLGPGDARGMTDETSLFGIDIFHDGRIELGYSFKPGVGWDDAMFNVAIDGWTPRPVSLDD